MSSANVLQFVREHGTEGAVLEVLSLERKLGSDVLLEKQSAILARLISILEKKHVIRRGHVISVICAAEGIEEDQDETAEHEHRSEG